MLFKNLERKLERESLKRTIFASGGLGPLQLVSEPGSGQCANEDEGEWTPGGVPVRTLSPKVGGHQAVC